MTQNCIEYYKNKYANTQGQKYPCGNQCVHCAILCHRIDDKINELLKNKKADVIFNTKSLKRVSFDNEDQSIQTVHPEYRGYRYHKVYIDTRISDEIMDEVIAPCMSFYCKEVNFF